MDNLGILIPDPEPHVSAARAAEQAGDWEWAWWHWIMAYYDLGVGLANYPPDLVNSHHHREILAEQAQYMANAEAIIKVLLFVYGSMLLAQFQRLLYFRILGFG